MEEEKAATISRHGRNSSLDEAAFASVVFGADDLTTDDEVSLVMSVEEIVLDYDIEHQHTPLPIEEFNANRRSKKRLEFCKVFLVVATTLFLTISLASTASHVIQQRRGTANDPKNTIPAAKNSPVDDNTRTGSILQQGIDEGPADTSKTIIPFSARHNLDFDGLLFVKNQNQSNSFDAYAKTLDPVTELHFTAGESTTTKEIVLSATAPDLMNAGPKAALGNENVVLTIGLQSNGELWLPHNTLQNVAVSSSEDRDASFHLQNIYGAGDRFELVISKNTITLFRNDFHELVGMWTNPLKHRNESGDAIPLYAQVWFKDPKSSMMMYALQ